MTKDRWENTVWDTDVYLDEIDKMNDIKVPPFTDGQKEIIEATEKLANGKLICDADDDITDIKELLNDTIIRIENPTNEDWLRSATTEELAEFIRKQRDDWSDGWYSDCHRFEEILEWLKQPHTAK